MTLSVRLAHRFSGFDLDVDFTAPAGVTALFGRSGAGKSTVVRAVAGLVRPQAGRVVAKGTVLFDHAAGIDLPAHRRGIGYVFQDGRLFPHLTVGGNLAYGRRFRRDASGAFAGIDAVVDLLGLGPLIERRPGALSGGEQQRVAIGRAILAGPRLMLMDEPLAALDAGRKAEILPYLERLRDEVRIPILYVSHALDEVARLATTLVVMADGRVVAAGPTRDLLADPDLVPDLGIGEAGAMLIATVAAHHPSDGLTELAAAGTRLFLPRVEAAVGDRLTVRVHADDVILARDRPEGLSALNILPVTVTAIHVGHGPGAAVALAAGDDRLLARVTRRSVTALNLVPGVACHAVVKSLSIARPDIGRADISRADIDHLGLPGT